MTTWIKDARGNKCSVEWFGTKKAAQAALDSLKNCDNCTNCSDCSRCSDCSDLYFKQNIKAVAVGETNNGPPPIPVITNIHRAIYAAASAPGRLKCRMFTNAKKRIVAEDGQSRSQASSAETLRHSTIGNWRRC